MKYIVTKQDGSRRIDKFVRKILNDAPLSFIYKMFRKKDIKVNSKKVDINYIIKPGDEIDIYITESYLKKFQSNKEIKIVKNDLKIIYEDENILVIDKPVGILVHNGIKEITLQMLVNSYLSQKKDNYPNFTNFSAAPAHRLDRNTSGIIFFGKNELALQELYKLFLNRENIEKKYIALVSGITSNKGTINKNILKDEKTGISKITSSNHGKSALTKYSKIEEIGKKYSLLEVEILTGRTHQIRLHLAYIKHPIIGDSKYGDYKLNKEFEKEYGLKNQFLHSSFFKFGTLEGYLSYLSNKEFVSPLPEKYNNILNELRKKT